MDLFGHIPTSMSALSWRQPFGTAMLLDKVETRTWHTNYRGKVLICTSKNAYHEDTVKKICGDEQYARLMETLRTELEIDTLDLDGYAIAVGELFACRRMKPSDEDSTFVKYRPGLWCHFYKNVRAIKPIPWTGNVRWMTLDQSIISQIQYLDAAA